MKPSPSSPNLPQLQVSATDEDVIARVASLFGVKYRLANKSPKKRSYKKAWIVKKVGFQAVELMKLLRPLMGVRRQRQIDKAIGSYSAKTRKITDEEQLEIVRLCESGMKQAKIAEVYGIRRETVNRIRKRHVA